MKITKVYQDPDTHDLIFEFDDGYKWYTTWIDADDPETPEEKMEWDAGFILEIPRDWERMRKESNAMLHFSHVWEYIKEKIPTFALDIENDMGDVYYENTFNFEQIKLLITPQS